MTYAVSLIIAVLIVSVLAILRAQRNINKSENLTESDLEEWTCPECGFEVQAGEECIYCYTKKSDYTK